MKKILWRWFSFPQLKNDFEAKHRAQLLNVVITATILFESIIVLGDLLGGKTSVGVIMLQLIFVAACIMLRVALCNGKIKMVGLLLLIAGYAVITWVSILLGTIRSPTSAGYMLLVVAAGVIFEFRGIVITNIVLSVTILGLILAQRAGLLAQPDYSVNITQWITYTGMFGIAGGMTFATYQNTQRTLARLKKEIVERQVVEDNLRASEIRFRALFEQTNDAVFILDLNGNHQAANQRAADMLGYTLPEMEEMSLRQTSAELNKSLDVLSLLKKGVRVPPYERLFYKKDGQVIPVEINVELVRDKHGLPHHIQSVVRDISVRKLVEEKLRSTNEMLNLRVAEVERLQAELREQALRDPLTGLYNRRYQTEMLDRELARAEREGSQLSIIVSDIDHFKEINDTYGHQVGDQFLIEIAYLMKKCTRESDLICRYGGEEFLIVLPGTSLSAASRRAEEIRQLCEKAGISHDGKIIQTTVSFGVAAYPVSGKVADEIIIKADKAMYQSKEAGRNRVTLWGESLKKD